MARIYNNKSFLCTGLLCLILILETSVLGNAFVFYTGLPRYIPFFILVGFAFLIAYPFKFKSFNKTGIILGILIFLALISDSFFSLEHSLYAVKIVALIFLVNVCIKDYAVLRRSLGLSFLYLSNMGIILALLAILLPEFLSLETNYIEDLRRQESGYGGIFYWSKNFSGLFLIGDTPNPVEILSQIPRYAGYFSEPAINAFYLCISLALLFSTEYKFSKSLIALTLINFLITFSVAGFVSLALLYLIKILLDSKMIYSLSVLIYLFIFLIFFIPFILNTEYIQAKLGGSMAGSLLAWDAIFNSNIYNLTSFNARVGSYTENLNLISVIFWLSVLAYISILFAFRIFSFQGTSHHNKSITPNPKRDLWILVLITFSIKSISHTLFMPIIFVLISQLIFSNQSNSLSKS